MAQRSVLRLATLLAVHLCPVAPASAQERVAVLSEPGTPVIATEVLVAAGPVNEGEEEAGLANLAARAVIAPLRPVFDSLGVRLGVDAHKDALSFSLIAAPDVWEEATRRLMIALFRDPVDGATVERERRDIQAELAARRTNPADVVAREADAAFYGPDHPWGRAAVGSFESVGGLSLTEVDGFLRSHFRPDRTVAAVVGPADPDIVRDHLGSFIDVPPASFPLPPPASPADSAVERDYNTVTTWVSASYGFPPGADVEALRLLAFLGTEELSFGPSRTSVYNVRSEVSPRLGGGEIRFQVVIPPGEAGDWAARIADAIDGASGDTPDDVFEARLRRYRGERLMQLAAPENRARELARSLLLIGEASPLPIDYLITRERLAEAARSLGPPTLVFVGPFFEDAAVAKGSP